MVKLEKNGVSIIIEPQDSPDIGRLGDEGEAVTDSKKMW